MHLATFIRGLSIGFILGVLFAPDKGTATRRKLSGLISDISDDVEDTCNDITTAIADKVKEIKETAKDITNPGSGSLAGIATEEAANP